MKLTPEKLKKLSKEQKLELYEVVQEKKRRNKLRKVNYFDSINEMQSDVHKCEKRIRVLLSGNGSGKSTCLVQEAVWRCQGYNSFLKKYTKVPANVVVLVDLPSKIAERWKPEIDKFFNIPEDAWKKNGKPYYTQIVFKNGSVLNFMTGNQDQLAFESIEIDALFIDEPCKRDHWVGLTRGMRKKNRTKQEDPKTIFMAGTPIAASWIRKSILVPWAKGELPDVECFQHSSDVNKENVDWKSMEQWFKMLSDKELKTRRYGEIFEAEGLALADIWDKEKHIIKNADFGWNRSWPCVIAVDPHTAKPQAAVLVGIDPKNRLYVLDEAKEKIIPREFISNYLKPWIEDFRVIDIVVDCAGAAEGTGGEGYKSFLQVANEEGVICRSTRKKEKDDEEFVQRIRDALTITKLGEPTLRVLEHCIYTISNIENAAWQYDKTNEMNKNKLDIRELDLLAALKYALASNLFFKKAESRPKYRQIPKAYGGQYARQVYQPPKVDWERD